jgi:hypothetical protein
MPLAMVFDVPGDRCRAVHRGQDADVVASGNASVGAHDALEKGLGLRRVVGVYAVGIITREIAHFDVVHVHMLAGINGL